MFDSLPCQGLYVEIEDTSRADRGSSGLEVLLDVSVGATMVAPVRSISAIVTETVHICLGP